MGGELIGRGFGREKIMTLGKGRNYVFKHNYMGFRLVLIKCFHCL